MNSYYPHLFQPMRIKKTVFKNRILSAPNMMCQQTPEGFPNHYMIAYYEAKAKGGAAQVTVGDTPVNNTTAISNPHHFVIYDETCSRYVGQLVRAIKSHGAVASIELNHAGCVGVDPIGPVGFIRDWDGVEVREMDEAMMNEVADDFANCARIAKLVGFDMVMLHGAHGWLLGQFLSPLYNTRTDEYGGSLENRAKFPLMVIDRVRQACGEDFLIEYRLSGEECIEGGLSVEDAIAFAKMLEGKVDLLHMSAALDVEEQQAVITHPTMFLPHGVNVKYAAAVKKEVSIPIVTIGAISEPDMAEEILASGKADFIGMTRALIADPDLPNKWKHGQTEDVIPCIRCLDCLTGMHEREQFACAMNPRTGHEFRLDITVKPATKQRKVLVVGGGAAGMMAAAVAAERGHQVILCEKSDKLGGLLQFTDYDTLKYDLRRMKDYLIHRVSVSGAEIRLNTEATPDLVAELGCDAVMVAVGASPAMPPIPGLKDPSVLHATEIYTQSSLGESIIVLGGGLVGCETALYLAEKGHQVQIIEMQEELAPESNWMHKEGMMQAFAKTSIVIHTGTRVCEVNKSGVCVIESNGKQVELSADTVVYALGMRPLQKEADAFYACNADVIQLGDCVAPRKVRQAVFEAYHAAIDLA